MMFLFSFFFSFCFSDSEGVNTVKALIEKGRFVEAKKTASNIISQVGFLDADINLFYLRGQCNYELKKYKDAIDDLSQVISSENIDKKTKSKSYSIRGNCYVKLGRIDDAERDSQNANDGALAKIVKNCKAIYEKIQSLKEENDSHLNAEIMAYYRDLINTSEYSVDLMVEAASFAFDHDMYDDFQEVSSEAVRIDSANLKLLEIRGKFFFCENDFDFAKRHLLSCAKRSSGGNKCPSLNRQNNEFATATEKFERAYNSSNLEDAELFANKCLTIATNNCKNGSKRYLASQAMLIKLQLLKGNTKTALSMLDDVLNDFPNSTELLTERAEIYRKMGDLDAANRDYQQIKKIDPMNKKAEKAIADIYDQREKEKKCDYYKLLNLSKDFTQSQLKTALKKAIRLYHPDQYSDPIKKKEAEKKMVFVNKAAEVLGDPQKKALYDRGEDPDNPGFRPNDGNNQQQNFFRAGNPNVHFVFQNGGNPFNIFFGNGAGGFGFFN